ncbi:MAG: hypothetical protein NZ893_01520, partial [Candidatus Aenigmarchaeota archaeon]|nr:hypothetical protein [Candidatus Aenigmarchaeota archaeon]
MNLFGLVKSGLETIKKKVEETGKAIQKGIGAIETWIGVDIPFVGKTAKEIKQSRSQPTTTAYQTPSQTTRPTQQQPQQQTTKPQTTYQSYQPPSYQSIPTYQSQSSQQQSSVTTFSTGTSVNEITLGLLNEELKKQGSYIKNVELKPDGTFE